MRLAVAVCVLLAASPAHADPPWADGVPKPRQAQANALFAEANQLFAEQAHAPALEKYRAAIALWDHPLIELNMAVTLIRLDRILEAAEAFDKALRFGAAPFPTPEQYQQALDYQKLVAGRVGTVEASCDQPNTAVLFDGKPWFSCPGTQARRVLAGEHVLVAEADGFMTLSRRIVISGHDSTHAQIHLLPLDEVATLEYASPRWLPWTVTGAGVAVGLGGLGLWFAGNSAMDRFEARVRIECVPDGCSKNLDANETERDLARQRDSARTEGNIGVAMMVAGGAITAGGIVWTVLNRPRRVLPTLELSPTSGGASATVGWRF